MRAVTRLPMLPRCVGSTRSGERAWSSRAAKTAPSIKAAPQKQVKIVPLSHTRRRSKSARKLPPMGNGGSLPRSIALGCDWRVFPLSNSPSPTSCSPRVSRRPKLVSIAGTNDPNVSARPRWMISHGPQVIGIFFLRYFVSTTGRCARCVPAYASWKIVARVRQGAFCPVRSVPRCPRFVSTSNVRFFVVRPTRWTCMLTRFFVENGLGAARKCSAILAIFCLKENDCVGLCA